MTRWPISVTNGGNLYRTTWGSIGHQPLCHITSLCTPLNVLKYRNNCLPGSLLRMIKLSTSSSTSRLKKKVCFVLWLFEKAHYHLSWTIMMNPHAFLKYSSRLFPHCWPNHWGFAELCLGGLFYSPSRAREIQSQYAKTQVVYLFFGEGVPCINGSFCILKSFLLCLLGARFTHGHSDLGELLFLWCRLPCSMSGLWNYAKPSTIWPQVSEFVFRLLYNCKYKLIEVSFLFEQEISLATRLSESQGQTTPMGTFTRMECWCSKKSSLLVRRSSRKQRKQSPGKGQYQVGFIKQECNAVT